MKPVLTDDIKLPPFHYDELPEYGDAIPAMHDYARRAIKADRLQRGEPVYLARFDNGFWQDCSKERFYSLKDPTSFTIERWGFRVLYTTPQPAAPAQEPSDDLMNALRNQRQIDRDGTEVGVSRQALDEAIALLARYGSKP